MRGLIAVGVLLVAGCYDLGALRARSDGGADLSAGAGADLASGDFALFDGGAPLGNPQVVSGGDGNSAGVAQAFRYVASASGTVTALFVYLTSGTSTNVMIAGLYDEAGGVPNQLLASGTLNGVSLNDWNRVALPGASIISGQPYWIAVLSPVGSGFLQFRDQFVGTSSNSTNQNLSALPQTWNGTPAAVSNLSAYATF